MKAVTVQKRLRKRRRKKKTKKRKTRKVTSSESESTDSESEVQKQKIKKHKKETSPKPKTRHIRKKPSHKCASPPSSPHSIPHSTSPSPPLSSSAQKMKMQSPLKSGTSTQGALDLGSIPTIAASGRVSVSSEQWLQLMDYVQ